MTRHLFLAVLGVGLLAFVVAPARAQPAVAADASAEQLWTDAVYYFKIARMDVGQAHLQAFLDRNPKPLDVLVLSENDPSASKIFIKLQSDKKLGKLASKALALIDRGWQQQRQDQIRVAAELDRLGGTPRARFHALNRLADSGEYAVPVMVRYLSDPQKKALYGRLIEAAVHLGRGSIEGLVVALPHVDAKAQLLIIEGLAQLDYGQVVPYLKQLAEDGRAPESVRQAAGAAIERILQRNPKYRVGADAAGLFYLLAQRYYYRDSAVLPAVPSKALAGDVRADAPNVWLWRAGKVVNQSVPWAIYHELMTMRLARRAIELDAGSDEALTLWLMANCRRELRLSETVRDPLHDEAFPNSGYFFRTAGTGYCLAALDRALADKDVAVALAALRALTDVAAGEDILATTGGGQPIVKALNFPNQLVRYWSALALGWSAPEQAYPSVGRVVGLLGKTLLGPKDPVACVVSADKGASEQLASALKELGYQPAVFSDFESCQAALGKVRERVEVFVIDYALPTPGARQAVAGIADDPLLSLVPTVVVASGGQAADAKLVLKGLRQVVVLPGVPDKAILGGQLGHLQRELGREVAAADEVRHMALLAAKGLERLATTTGSKQYDVSQAGRYLIEGAAKADWDLARQCARVLVHLSGADAQQGLAAAALKRSDVAQKIAMFELVRISVRKWGSRLTADQVALLQKIVTTETNAPLRDSAAAVVGALNLKSDEARKVVLIKDALGKIGGE